MTCEQFDLEADSCTDSSRWLPPVPVEIWHNMRVHGGHWDLCYKPGDPLELVLRWDVPGGMDPLGFALDLHSPGYGHEPGCRYADEARDAVAAVTRVTGDEDPGIVSAGDVAVVAGAAYAVTTHPVQVWRAIEMPAPCLSRGGGGVSVHRTQQAGPPLPVTLDGSDEFAVWVARHGPYTADQVWEMIPRMQDTPSTDVELTLRGGVPVTAHHLVGGWYVITPAAAHKGR